MKQFWLSLLLVIIAATLVSAESDKIPAPEDRVIERLEASPRHGEWVSIDAGGGDTLDAWLVYPERSDNAPVVVVIHEIFGLTDWIRGVADQLAAEGFIAVAPDLLSGKAPGGGGSRDVSRDAARGLIRGLDWNEVKRRLDAAARYATSLPAATSKYGTVGYCWGGGTSFSYAVEQPGLDAAVVYYGVSPATNTLKQVKAPVLGLYGEDDNRVNATIPDARDEMKRLNKRYEVEIYSGAGHGFLRNLSGRGASNLKAAEKAWPKMVEFLKEVLE